METDKCVLCGDELDRPTDIYKDPTCFNCFWNLDKYEYIRGIDNYIRSIKIKNILNG
jgi:hypothetical protein